MRKYHFNNLKLRNKLLILYLFSVFIPIILTNIIFYNVTINNVKEQKMVDITLTLEQIKDDFLLNIEQAVGISVGIYTDNNINEFLEREYSSSSDYVEAYDIHLRGFNKYSSIFSSIDEISFYTDNPTVIYSGGVNPLSTQVQQTEWYRNLTSINQSTPIVLRTGIDQKRDTFSIIRELNFFGIYNKTNKMMKIDIDHNVIYHIFQNANFQGDVYLVNENGEIEYTTNPAVKLIKEPIPLSSIQIPEEAMILEEAFSTNNYLKNWKVIGVISEEEILEAVYHSKMFIFYLACLNFLVPSVIIILISRSLNFRLNRILKYMRRMKSPNFVTIKGVEYQDEIGQLTSEFNRMSIKIEELINDVYVVNIQKKDLELQRKQAQLNALQSQINPHFLFNVLETIRMRSIIKSENETAKIIENLAKILRRSITWGKDWVSIGEELIVISSFLEIQKYRFDEKLEYTIDIDADAKNCLIPNMVLLPFVENASIHGVEPKKDKGEISILIKRNKHMLECTIKDNGPGINGEKIREMLSSLQSGEEIGENVGIKNVYYRLKMYYGNDFYFNIGSMVNKGTIVTLHVPYSINNMNNRLKTPPLDN